MEFKQMSHCGIVHELLQDDVNLSKLLTLAIALTQRPCKRASTGARTVHWNV